MTPAARALWERAQKRAQGMQPEIAAAVLRAFAILRDSLTEAQLTRLIESGDIDRLFREALSNDVMDRAVLPLRQRIRQGLEKNVLYFARDLPKAGKVDGVLTVAFDWLNPRVVDAVRGLETKVVTTLQADVRETVRAYVENGLRDGVNPRTVARSLRSVIGLAPNQETAVRNFEAALRSGTRKALTYQLRDRRFDGTVKKGALSEAQITTQVAAYRKRMVAFNANTNARTAALDAMKLGQRLSWQDAIDKGIVEADRLMKEWITVLDGRERPEHNAQNGDTVPFNEPFSNGEITPGESTYNCRCVARVFQARA